MKMSFLISRDSKFLYQKLEQMEIEIAELDNKNNELEIEIAELKEKQRVDRQCEACKLGDLIVENTKLKKDKEYLDKVNNEQTEVILKLNEQIEKMKCCGNCKHCYSKNDEENVITCAYDDEIAYLSLRNCDKWELVEYL